MSFTPAQPGMALAAASAASVPLINGTQVLCSWTAPADGRLHWAQAFCCQTVTAAETGGAVNFTAGLPTGGTANEALYNGGSGIGSSMSYGPATPVAPGATVQVVQATALTAGAAAVCAGIFAS